LKILVAEDDANILNALCEIFENEGFDTLKARNGEQALDFYNTEKPDFICLDIMMPKINGYDVCKTIRQTNANIPIIFLSAKVEESDRVIGLELGADDYIIKPFGVREVVARIRAVTRRYMQASNANTVDDFFVMDDLNVYPLRLKARRMHQQDEIELSLREVKILQLLFDRKNEVIDRDTLLDYCWGEHIMPESRTVDQHIANLRKRVEKDPKNPEIITTVHGAGYRFSAV
tara:strand:- start:1727 stop:2422 length:696 start_codon:yes stop_codon:yes gene_type:complete